MKQLIFSVLLFTFVSYSSAFEKDSLNAVESFNQNGLQLHFVLINDKEFIDKWEKPETPKISPIDTYKRGEDVIPIIIFSTDGKDSVGNANLTYDIKIVKPDGTIYGEFKQLEVWKDAPAPIMHLIKQPIDIHLEENDPIGIYKVQTTIYENVKKVRVNFELAFQVVK